MFSDAEDNSFRVDLPLGYMEVCLLWSAFVYRGPLGGNLERDGVILETKFTATTLEKLVLLNPGVIASEIISPPTHEPAVYQTEVVGYYREEVNMAMNQLRQKLSGFRERLPPGPREVILAKCCRFLIKVIEWGVMSGHRALWASATCTFVNTIAYNEQNSEHRMMVTEQRRQNARPNILACVVCRRDIQREMYIEMPSAGYCHGKCLWNWPREA